MTFLVQIQVDRFRLSAMGLFNVGMHLIPSVSDLYLMYYKKSKLSVGLTKTFIKAARRYRDVYGYSPGKLK